MAAIGTIRKYSGLAVGVIGFAIIVFVVSDALNPNRPIFGNDRNELNVGIIGGEKISFDEFNNRYKFELDKIQGFRGSELSDEEKKQLRDEIWEKYVNEFVYETEYNYIGIDISGDELFYNAQSKNPHQLIKSFFVNENREFDKSLMVSFFQNMDNYPKYKPIWLDYEEIIQKDLLKNKYMSLVKNSLYTTKVEALDKYYAKNKFASIQYVNLPINEIPDTLVSYDDKDLQKKYEEIKEQNINEEETRSIEYVAFPIIPSKDDTLELLKKFQDYKIKFAETEKDSMYAVVNSELPHDTNFYYRGHYSKIINNYFYNNPNKDTVIGPFVEGGYVKIAKLLRSKEDTLKYTARHILLKSENKTDEQIKEDYEKLKDYMQRVKDGEDFAMLAMRYSEDGSRMKGGDLGWFPDSVMVEPFMKAVKSLKKDEMTIVKSEFGYHLIQVTENPSNLKLNIGIVAKRVNPGDETIKLAYNTALQFRNSVNNLEEFKAVASEKGYNIQMANDVRPDVGEVPGIPNSKPVITWAYNAELNDLSTNIIELDNSFVIATLTEINEKGPFSFDKIKDIVTAETIRDKKLDYQLEKLKEASNGKSDLKEIAAALNKNIENKTDASFDVPFIPGIGDEKMLMGYIFGTDVNKLSEPIKGTNAVFQIQVLSFTEVEEPSDLSAVKKELTDNMKGISQSTALKYLKDNAEIKDYRYKLY